MYATISVVEIDCGYESSYKIPKKFIKYHSTLEQSKQYFYTEMVDFFGKNYEKCYVPLELSEINESKIFMTLETADNEVILKSLRDEKFKGSIRGTLLSYGTTGGLHMTIAS